MANEFANADYKMVADKEKTGEDHDPNRNNKITIEPLPASKIPKPKYGFPTDNRARQMKLGEDITTT
jgi:hypothetical protein